MSINPDSQEVLEEIAEAELAGLEYNEQILAAHNFMQIPEGYDFGDNRFRDPATDYFCWRGITEIAPADGKGKILAESCDPQSYTGARTRFCITFNCKDKYRYADFLPGDNMTTIPNRRGGIVIKNNIEQCSKGGVGGFVYCLTDGVKESIGNTLQPENKMKLVTSAVALTLLFLVVVRIARRRKSQKMTGRRK